MPALFADLDCSPFTPSEGALDVLAMAMLERCLAWRVDGAHAAHPVTGEVTRAQRDFSDVLILAPSLSMAAELRQAFVRANTANTAKAAKALATSLNPLNSPSNATDPLPGVVAPLFLPRFSTLRLWAESVPLDEFVAPLSDSERLVLLYETLRQRAWFDEIALWGIAREMAALFDALTYSAQGLPSDEATLAAQLERAYQCRAAKPLAFEARVVHELWRALAAVGRPDEAGAYRLRLGRLTERAECAERTLAPERCLLVLLDAPPAEALFPVEQDFLQRYSRAQTTHVFYPETRATSRSALLKTLAVAWPEPEAAGETFLVHNTAAPLFLRAQQLQAELPHSPLLDRLQLTPSLGREQEAQAAVAQVLAWLAQGLRRIVLLAQDRLTARRVLALLEREQILVEDETGWKLSTSRAAAGLDALLECAVQGAAGVYYRDFLDLCKSPYFFADYPVAQRKAAVFALEEAIRAASVCSGLQRIRTALQRRLHAREELLAAQQVCAENAPPKTAEAAVLSSAQRATQAAEAAERCAAERLALLLLDRLEAALALLQPAAPQPRPQLQTQLQTQLQLYPLASWIDRLLQALELLAALAPLRAHPAGLAALDLLAQRQSVLAHSTVLFSFAAWRDWLDREFEAATFRDRQISSPIVLTPLNALCLRSFEAALLLGGDARQLSAASSGAFLNESVRQALGVPTRREARQTLRRALSLLLATVPRVVVSWRSEQEGEANLLAPEFELLATLHRLVWHDDLHRAALPSDVGLGLGGDGATLPPSAELPLQAAAVAPPSLIPQRVSVSAYASLLDCPYRFFARYVLALGELDEVSESMAKRDYGALVHRVLEQFHSAYPVLAECAEADALAALQRCSEAVFAPAIAADFLALGWFLRWQKRLPAYLDWQRTWEAKGWRWSQAEFRVSRVLPLPAPVLPDDSVVDLVVDLVADLAADLAVDSAQADATKQLSHSVAHSVELYGRIDRIDCMAAANEAQCASSVALLDYKTQQASKIRQGLARDVQLPLYALLHDDVAEAAYVALDDERVRAVAVGDAAGSLLFDAAAEGERVQQIFAQMYAGAALPAHGLERVCRYCEMRGLCRRALT
ncbi:MAG: PD-(D/E)XK nuclease family protein [Pseudomonadota bacterium]